MLLNALGYSEEQVTLIYITVFLNDSDFSFIYSLLITGFFDYAFKKKAMSYDR